MGFAGTPCLTKLCRVTLRPVPHPLTPPDRRSVAAKRQARYRDRRRQPKVYPRKRCRNCPKFFLQTHPRKLFCSRECTNQFHRYGFAYGPLKAHLENKLIPKLVTERVDLHVVAFTEMFRIHRERLLALENGLREQQRALDLIVGTMAHKHEPLKELRDKIRELDARISSFEKAVR
jgi:hypothetical protein